MRYLLLPLLLLLCTGLAAQDCRSDLYYSLDNLRHNPPLDCFSASANVRRVNDLLRSIQRDHRRDAEAAFDELIVALPESPAFLDLYGVLMYAIYLEEAGEPTAADAYLNYLTHAAQPYPNIRLVALAHQAGQNKSLERNQSIRDQVQKEVGSDAYASRAKVSAVIHLSYLLPPKKQLAYLERNVGLLEQSTDEITRHDYLAVLGHTQVFIDPAAGSKTLATIEALGVFSVDSTKQRLYHIIKAKSLSNDGQYRAAVAEASKALDIFLDADNARASIDSLMLGRPAKDWTEVGRYGIINLYRTRVGDGLAPVQETFSLFEKGYQVKLAAQAARIDGLTTEQYQVKTSNVVNHLIVGDYLATATADPSVMDRTMGIVDRVGGLSTEYWIKARAQERRTGDLMDDLSREQRAIRQLKDEATWSDPRKLRAAHRELDAVRRANQAKHPGFFTETLPPDSLALRDFRRELARDSAAFVGFYGTDAVLYRVFMDPDTVAVQKLPDVLPEINALIRKLLPEMSPRGTLKSTTAPARRIYRLLLGDLDARLPATVHIVTGGVLEQIPFAALRRDSTGRRPRYLGAEVALSRQFSIRSLRLLNALDLSPRRPAPLGLAPRFRNDVQYASDLRQAEFVLPPLLYGREEMDNLRHRGSGRYLYDDNATVAGYRRYAPDHSILHLATHAISSQIDGLRSRIFLLDEAGEPTPLYAGDIGDQTLNANLVVLSACETSLGGRDFSEGRVGLTKAYLAAGARSVVSSAWAVDDRATADVMSLFYDGIERGQPPHRALQHARAAYLQRHPTAPPYRWAAFEAYGGTRSVRLEPDSLLRRALPWVGGVLALVAVGYLLFRIRRSTETRTSV